MSMKKNVRYGALTLIITLIASLSTACAPNKNTDASAPTLSSSSPSASPVGATAANSSAATASPGTSATTTPTTAVSATSAATTATTAPKTTEAGTVATAPASASPTASPSAAPSVAPKATVSADAGAALFKANCTACHGVDLEGDIGPNLQKIGGVLTKEQIVNQIQKGGGGMPPFEKMLKDEEIQALAAWLATKK